jgi:hypothetical protein
MTGLVTVEIALAAACVMGVTLTLRRRENHPPAPLAASNCPDCGRVYGPDIFVSTVPVAYRWVLARGHTRESLKLPRVTHLVTCPRCVAEYEFHPDGSLFEHPQRGVLSCVRTGRARAIPAPAPRIKPSVAA